MAAKRLTMHRLQEFIRLHRLGRSAREVARLLKMGRSTESRYRKALGAAGLLEGDPDTLPEPAALRAAVARHAPAKPAKQQISTVEPWRAKIAKMLLRGARPKAIYDCLRLRDKSFECSLSAVKRFCNRLDQERGVSPADVAIPVETLPGEIGQVDFGYAGRIYDPEAGTRRRAWVFVMTLAFSRRLFACVVFDQKVETWLQCHIDAFRHFGGVPEVVVPDNLKAAVVRCAFAVDDETALNRSYRELARYYGFTVDPTPPRSPEKKGKAESSVKYVKNNFFKPRDLDELGVAGTRKELAQWLAEVADVRVHGTTGERPIERFEREEKAALRPLPDGPFEIVLWKEAKVHPDSHVIFHKRLYSVPFQLIGQQVWIRATPSALTIFSGKDERVATHGRRFPGHRSTVESHLPEHRAPWRHRSRRFWQERASRIGDGAHRLIAEIFRSEDVLSKLRVVQAIVTHLEQFPRERANAACERARHYGNYTYGGIKDILRHGLDFEPPTTVSPGNGALTQPRFARSAAELAGHHRKEKKHERAR